MAEPLRGIVRRVAVKCGIVQAILAKCGDILRVHPQRLAQLAQARGVGGARVPVQLGRTPLVREVLDVVVGRVGGARGLVAVAVAWNFKEIRGCCLFTI